MSGFVARWPVRQEHEVRQRDLDADGNVSASTLERWALDACSEYLDRCVVLQNWCVQSGLRLARHLSDMGAETPITRTRALAVSAGATEIRPKEIIVAVRVRALGGDAATANGRCTVTAEDPATGNPQELSVAVREEVIMLQQSAANFN